MHRFLNFIFSINFIYLILIVVQLATIIFLSVFIPSILPFVTLYVGGFLLNITAGFMLLNKNSENEIKIAWLIFILSIPFLGASTYFLFSHKRKREYHLQFTADNTGLAAVANAYCGTCNAKYDRASYFDNGNEFFDSLFFDIENAEKSIFVEFYLIDRGEIFTRFISALTIAKNRGVDIRILVDGLGSLMKLKGGRRKLKSLATLKFYSKFSPFPKRLNARTHRKIIVIDSEIAYTGGINLADEYANLISPYGHWKDIGVRIQGEAAKGFEGLFLALWQGNYIANALEVGERNCLVYGDSPDRHFLKSAYLAAIYSAKKRVHIMTPYLSPPTELISALAFAAAKGVDVKIIIPAIPDKPYAYEITKAFSCKLKERGIEVYTYDLGFVHAKSFIVDNACFIGSSNFDFRSLSYNYECGVHFTGEIAQSAETDFIETLKNCSLFSDCPNKFKSFKRVITRLFAPLI